MKKVIRLRESELISLIGKVIREDYELSIESVMKKVKSVLKDNEIDADDMDDSELYNSLVKLMKSTENKVLKHKLRNLESQIRFLTFA